MDDFLDLFIYLDDGLVKSLSSVILNGYIDIRTYRNIRDRTLAGRLNVENRDQVSDSTRIARDFTKGYKSKHKFLDHIRTLSNDRDGSFEDREYERVEEEIKRIYTSFSIYSQLIANISSSNSLKYIKPNVNPNNHNIIDGDYVEINGNTCSTSIVCYIDALIALLTCCGVNKLNKLLEKSNPGFFDFTGILEMLNTLKKILTGNSTQDLILNCGEVPIVLPTNNTCFLNNNDYIFNKVNCPCKVFGKVMKCCGNNEEIGLFRKSAQQKYYEDFLNVLDPYLDLLKRNGIPLPQKCDTCITNNALLVLPISIYV